MSRRQFSPEFKRKVVEEHLKAGKRVSEILREYQICGSVFDRWRQQYNADAIAQPASADELARELRDAKGRIDELEGALGRTSMELDFMTRAFKRAGLPFPNGPRS